MVLLLQLKIDIDGLTAATQIFSRPFARCKVRESAALGVWAPDMIQQRFECVHYGLKLGLGEILPFIKMY